MTEKQKENEALIKEYPFLRLSNEWSGEHYDDDDYSYTWLDDMPDGWRKSFGKQMCDEIKEELIRCNYLDKYRIMQIKEKFGALRWYDCGIPDGCKVWDIVDKYEKISSHTCIVCGKPATKISTGWISPFCDKCADNINCNYKPIEEWFD